MTERVWQNGMCSCGFFMYKIFLSRSNGSRTNSSYFLDRRFGEIKQRTTMTEVMNWHAGAATRIPTWIELRRLLRDSWGARASCRLE
jgi:hypothetical protein